MSAWKVCILGFEILRRGFQATVSGNPLKEQKKQPFGLLSVAGRGIACPPAGGYRVRHPADESCALTQIVLVLYDVPNEFSTPGRFELLSLIIASFFMTNSSVWTTSQGLYLLV